MIVAQKTGDIDKNASKHPAVSVKINRFSTTPLLTGVEIERQSL
jgi:hypothetical protein